MKLSVSQEVTLMSIVAWWVIPVAVALIAGAVVVLHDHHRPHVRGSFEEVEDFRHFREALRRQNAEPSGSRR
jgi:hypothetical protein